MRWILVESVRAFARQQQSFQFSSVHHLRSSINIEAITYSRIQKASRWAACALAGASAAAFVVQQATEATAACLESPKSADLREDVTQYQIQEFKSWLSGLGANINALDIRESPEGRGLGLYPSAWAEEQYRASWLAYLQRLFRTAQETDLASFPLGTVVSTRLVTCQPGMGTEYEKLLTSGDFDDRVVVMLFLLVERLRGEDSDLSPWLKLLPSSFHTPLHFTEAQLQELKGTNLHAATRMLSGNLEKMWEGLQPVCQDLLQAASQGLRKATFQDFLWAYSTFWSRAQSLPVPTGMNGEVTTQESIVPGLDFANHASEHACRWTLWGGQKGSGIPDRVSLVTLPGAHLRTGKELCITYGGKSNEELLFLYGFALEDNENDMLMVKCPLPPTEQWNDIIRARLLLLLDQGLSPQLFLPALRLQADPGSQAQQLDAWLPQAAQSVLEAFLIEPAELARRMQTSQAGTSTLSGRSDDPGSAELAEDTQDATQRGIEDSEMKLATLTCLARVLEIKCDELEGEEGTGPLERDQQILEAATHSEGGDPLHTRLRSTILYRMGQKRLARDYLQLARLAIGSEMDQMRMLIAEEEAGL